MLFSIYYSGQKGKENDLIKLTQKIFYSSELIVSHSQLFLSNQNTLTLMFLQSSKQLI